MTDKKMIDVWDVWGVSEIEYKETWGHIRVSALISKNIPELVNIMGLRANKDALRGYLIGLMIQENQRLHKERETERAKGI